VNALNCNYNDKHNDSLRDRGDWEGDTCRGETAGSG